MTDKTKDELIKELQKLHQEYDSLKTSYEIDISEFKQAEEALSRQKDALLKFNNFSIGLSKLTLEDNLEAFIATKLKEITGARVATFSEYNPANRTITVKHIEIEPGLLEKVVSQLGQQVSSIRSEVSDEMYREMTTEIVGTRRTLFEASFGAIPRPVGAAVQALLKVDRFIGLAFIVEGKLYGTLLLAMGKNQPDPPIEILENFIYLAAVFLRRKQAEELLKENMERLNEAQKLAHIGVWDWKPDTDTVTWTNELYLIAGLDPTLPAPTYKEHSNLYTPESWELLKTRVEKAMETGESYQLELELIRPNGDTRYVNAFGGAKYDSKGQVIGLFGTVQDITERKHLKESLHESEMKLKTLFEELPIGVSILDAERNVAFVNPAIERILNMTKDGFIRGDYKNRKYLRADGTQMPEEEYASVRAIREQRVVHDVETGVLMEDGHVIWTNVNAAPVAFPDWKVVIITTDITERKMDEDAFRESEEKYRMLIESIDEGVGIVDREENFIYANSALEKIFNVDNEGLVGTSLKQFLSPENLELLLQKTYERRGKIGGTYEIEIILSGGAKKLIVITAAPRLGKNGEYLGTFATFRDITELRIARKELIESEKKYRELFEANADGLTVFLIQPEPDSQPTIIDLNENAAKMMGYTKEEMLNTIPYYYEIGLTKGKIEKRKKDIQTKGFTNFETIIRHKDGHNLTFEFNVKLINYNNQPCIMNIARDITKRKQIEELLRESENKYKSLIDNIPDIIFTIDLKGKISFISRRTKEILGYENAETLNMSIFNFIPEEDHQRAMENLQKGMKGEKIRHFQTPMIAKSGERLFFECSFSRIFKDGVVVGAQGTAVDITERKRTEETLRENETSYRELFNNIRSGVAIYEVKDNGNDFIFKDFNRAAERIDGDRKENIIGKSIYEARPGIKKFGLLEVFRRVLTTGVPEHFLSRFYSDEKLHVWYNNFVYRLSTSEIVAVYDDITESKQAEEELIKSNNLLKDLYMHQTDIRENERALISREIHDELGQSMTALKLDLNRMYIYVNTNPEAVMQLNSMIKLVSDTIKDVQRISSDLRPGILDDLGLVPAIEWYCEEFEKRTGIKCSQKLENSDYRDSQTNLTLFRALQETLTNVIRHAKASSVNVKLQLTQKGAILTIKDNGIGTPEEKIESHKSLGLISIRERVRQLNGKLDISSKKGDGTKLTIFIPT